MLMFLYSKFLLVDQLQMKLTSIQDISKRFLELIDYDLKKFLIIGV